MSAVHQEWLRKWEREVQEEYSRLHARATSDPQAAGHGGEATWVRLLQEWLPPAYEVGTRKYIVPEEGSDTFETDIVVFSPGYPQRLREREEVLAGGVAAAFSVKLTLDAEGVRDAVERAVRLKRGTKPRIGHPRGEMVGAFPVGLLAHSHTWKAPASTPRENLAKHLEERDQLEVEHPRESLDLLCVADLCSASRMRLPYMPPTALSVYESMGIDTSAGLAMSAMTMSDYSPDHTPVGSFVASLILKLSETDPLLVPFADGLRLTDTLGSGSGPMRFWRLPDVFSDDVIRQLPSRGFTDGNWSSTFF